MNGAKVIYKQIWKYEWQYVYSLKEPLHIQINKNLFKNNFQGQEGAKGCITKLYKEPFGGDGYTHFLDCVEGSQVYTYVKTYQLYTLNVCSLLFSNRISIQYFFNKNKFLEPKK